MNVVKLQPDYFPWKLEADFRDFVADDHNERHRESLGNLTRGVFYFGRQNEARTERCMFKKFC